MDTLEQLLDGLPPHSFPKLWLEAPGVWRAHIGFGNKEVGRRGYGDTPVKALQSAINAEG